MSSGKDELAKILAGAEKKYGFPAAAMGDIAVATKWISTGNMIIDYVIGGGIPMGRVIEIAGMPSSGKTTTALQAAANLQNIIISGGDPERGIDPDDKILYLDYEQAMDPEYAASLGLDVFHDSFIFAQPASLERGANFCLATMRTGRIRMVIVDSVAAMQPETKVDGEIGAYHVGLHAKFITDFVSNANNVAAEHNTALVLINHTKEKIGMSRPGMPPVRTTPGGVGAKFFASVRLEYEQRKQYKGKVYDPVMGTEDEQVVANDVQVKSVKNKLAPPYRKHIVRVRYGKGFDNFQAAITVLIAHKKVVHSSGHWYFHRLEDEGGAPEWMPRQSTGTKRPYIKGEANLNAAADADPAWRELLELMAETLIYEKPDPNAPTDEEEELEEESDSSPNKVSL